jgi:predicted DCC family thiol-disulfide oxidoreductase YuxK
VYFDADCGICLFISRLLKRLDPLERLTFQANSAESAPADVKALASETVVVKNEQGATFTKSGALSAVAASLPLLKPLGLILSIPFIRWLADRGYEAVSRHRAAISVWFGFEACGVSHDVPSEVGNPEWPIPELERALVGLRESVALLFLLVAAVALVGRMNDESRPQGLEAAAYSFVAYPRAYQDFKLFAPDPPKRMGTVVVEAQTTRGAKFDPLTGQPPLEGLDPKKRDPRARPSPLMAAYFSSINQPSKVIYVDELRNYLQKLGDQRDPSDKVAWFNVNWIEAPIPPPEGGEPTQTAGIAAPRRITSRP